MTKNGSVALVLAGALSCGIAIGAAVLHFQAERLWNITSEDDSLLRLDAFEGCVSMDSQTTLKGNRRIDFILEAAELKGNGFRIRVGWNRPFLNAQVIAGAGERFWAGSVLRVEPIRAEGFFWVDSEKIFALKAPRLISALRAKVASEFALAIKTAARGAGPLAQALLLGVKDELESESRSLFQAAGCAHLLALSGQHLSIICAFVSLVGTKMMQNAARVRRISIGFAWIFVWLAGPGPSLIGSVFMLTTIELAIALDRPQSPFSILSMESILVALFEPTSINSLSSIYSFSAMAGLIAFSGKFSIFLRPFLTKTFADALAASFAAVCGTSVISILAFGMLIPAGILSATAAAPIMLAFMWIALAGSVLVAIVPYAAFLIAPALEFLQYSLMAVLEWGASFPAINVADTFLAKLCACVLIASLVVLIYAIPRKRYRTSLSSLDSMQQRLSVKNAKNAFALLEAHEE
jgi:ComEC/Rec2-related protein